MPANHEMAACIVTDNCLQCPLSACKYDDVKPYHAWAKERGIRVYVAPIQKKGDGLPGRPVTCQCGQCLKCANRAKQRTSRERTKNGINS